jgi:phosphatidylglycerophosphatase A
MKKKLIMFFATGTYTGLAPFASGTVGSLWGIPLAYGISLINPIAGAVVIVLFTAISVYFANEASRILGQKDPGAIVIDEIAGFAVAAFLIPFTAQNIIIIFILFRIFDILKPPPVRQLEAIPGGAGIVADDIGAGIYANICTVLTLRFLL